MIVLKPYINSLKLSWIIKCLFLRTIEPLNSVFTDVHVITKPEECTNRNIGIVRKGHSQGAQPSQGSE